MLKDPAVSMLRVWPINTFLGRLPSHLYSELLALGTSQTCHAGSQYRIVKEFVLLITSGVLLLEYDQGDAAEQAVSTFCGPGDVVAVENALNVMPGYAGNRISAQVTTEILMLPTATFRDFLMKGTAMRALLSDLAYRHYQEKVHRAWERRPVVDHLRLFLEEMARRFGAEPSVPDDNIVDIEEMRLSALSINLTQNQMAKAIGASTGAVDKALGVLRGRGLVKTGYRTLHVKVRVKDQFRSAAEL